MDAVAPVLSVRGLKVEFATRHGRLTAIDGISFDVAPGEVLGVVGESGAGKSLTGASIIGLLDPPGMITGGEIRLEGRRIDDLRPEEMRHLRGRKIGMIFQDPLTSLNPLYTIGRQLTETIRTHLPLGRRAARNRAIELLEEVGIPGAARRLNAYPHQFSGGMRQRVVIALALAAEPALVIADEPTTALDVSVQAQIIKVLKRMCREHKAAVVLITHDMGVIAETADRVAVMYAGRIAEIGPVADVVKRPKHPYTAGLMGAIPRVDRSMARLTQIPGAMPRLDAIPRGCAFNPRCPEMFARCLLARPEPIAVDESRVACWLHDPDEAREAVFADFVHDEPEAVDEVEAAPAPQEAAAAVAEDRPADGAPRSRLVELTEDFEHIEDTPRAPRTAQAEPRAAQPKRGPVEPEYLAREAEAARAEAAPRGSLIEISADYSYVEPVKEPPAPPAPPPQEPPKPEPQLQPQPEPEPKAPEPAPAPAPEAAADAGEATTPDSAETPKKPREFKISADFLYVDDPVDEAADGFQMRPAAEAEYLAKETNEAIDAARALDPEKSRVVGVSGEYRHEETPEDAAPPPTPAPAASGEGTPAAPPATEPPAPAPAPAAQRPAVVPDPSIFLKPDWQRIVDR